jgi:hypothetical protein
MSADDFWKRYDLGVWKPAEEASSDAAVPEANVPEAKSE